MEQITFFVWLFFRWLFIALLFLFLISGIDDLFVDVIYYIRVFYRKIFRRKTIVPLTLQKLLSVNEKPIAIMVPAWDESAVIGRMLLNTVGTLNYRNYNIFVGVYPNDDATRIEVEKIRQVYNNIYAVTVPHNGPTNKADCLNWIYQNIKLFEKEHGVNFEIYVLHDSEDIVHPLSLKYYNYLMPRFHFIQVPVLPLETEMTDFVTGTYMDEFAENHTKEMRVRELVSNSIPSAGVGTAISREAMDFLADNNNNFIFDTTSVTEDYLLGMRLAGFKGRKIFLQQFTGGENGVVIEGKSNKQQNILLATREYFPTTFSAAVRQKSRWILGIALQGWRAGWGHSIGEAYYLLRDRKSLVTNIAVVAGYIVVAFTLFTWILNAFDNRVFPPVVSTDEYYFDILKFVFWLFVWRAFNRIYASWRIYGPVHGLMAFPRMIYGNFLNFSATCLAIKRFIKSRLSNTTPDWGKTAHLYPSEALLRAYRRKLGDILLDSRLITAEQLNDALEEQKKTGKKVGEILISKGILWEEDVVMAVAKQHNREYVEIDPYSVPEDIIHLIPQEIARKIRVFPIAFDGKIITVASDRDDIEEVIKELSLLTKKEIAVKLCASADIEFALEHGYRKKDGIALSPDDRLGQRLLKAGVISLVQLKNALRSQKRTDKPLGEILVAMNAISKEQLEKFLHEGKDNHTITQS